jgi:DNA-binding response OmpR family regulator
MARVLIIDDDEDFSALLSSMVKRAGHDALTVATIKEGMKALEGPCEVVFLDVHLPDGSGLGCCRVSGKPPHPRRSSS